MFRSLISLVWLLGLALSHAGPLLCSTAPADLMPGCDQEQGHDQAPATSVSPVHAGCGIASCPFPPSAMLIGRAERDNGPADHPGRHETPAQVLRPLSRPPLTPPPQA